MAETLAGIREHTVDHQWLVKVSPYDKNEKLLPEVSAVSPGEPGAGDKKIEAYNFRLCLTRNRSNRVAFPKPTDYDPRRYELWFGCLNLRGKKPVVFPGSTKSRESCVWPMEKADFQQQRCVLNGLHRHELGLP